MNSLSDLSKDPRGRWQATLTDGSVHVPVTVVRAFPIRAPDEAVSVIDHEGHELCWIDHTSELASPLSDAVVLALQEREFMPEILSVERVSSFATPSVWTVQTNRGKCEFTLKGEEDIRRVSAQTLIVADAHGVQFLIRDLPSLSASSRKLLDRFL
jgi:hypothetical protein